MESLGGLLFPLLILLLFIPIFLSGRKQRRQMQEMQQLQSSLDVGDVVTTTSGLRGTVVDSSYEDTIDLEIADGVITTWLRAAVREKVLDSATSDAPTTEIPTGDTPPAGTPAVAAADEPVDGPVGTGARTDGEVTPTTTADAPRDTNGTSRP